MINKGLYIIFSILIFIFSILTVFHKDLMKSALSLACVLFLTAFFYISFGFEFLGWTQILLYVGGIVVLILFVVMLAKEYVGRPIESGIRRPFLGGIISIILFIFLLWIILVTEFPETKDIQESLKSLPDFMFKTDYLLPFEILSLLLLAALFGGIVLARRE
ncbi:MAG: NADH-quinone oxidoreductase subunit J [candidate division WOR-3 bacterium]